MFGKSVGNQAWSCRGKNNKNSQRKQEHKLNKFFKVILLCHKFIFDSIVGSFTKQLDRLNNYKYITTGMYMFKV